MDAGLVLSSSCVDRIIRLYCPGMILRWIHVVRWTTVLSCERTSAARRSEPFGILKRRRSCPDALASLGWHVRRLSDCVRRVLSPAVAGHCYAPEHRARNPEPRIESRRFPPVLLGRFREPPRGRNHCAACRRSRWPRSRRDSSRESSRRPLVISRRANRRVGVESSSASSSKAGSAIPPSTWANEPSSAHPEAPGQEPFVDDHASSALGPVPRSVTPSVVEKWRAPSCVPVETSEDYHVSIRPVIGEGCEPSRRGMR